MHFFDNLQLYVNYFLNKSFNGMFFFLKKTFSKVHAIRIYIKIQILHLKKNLRKRKKTEEKLRYCENN